MNEKLRASIKVAGWTQKEFGRRCGLSAETISGLINGHYLPTRDQKNRIALCLGLLEAELFDSQPRHEQGEGCTDV